MNDMLVFGFCYVAVLLAIICFTFYHIYWGVHDSLTHANIGSVYNFRYFQPVTGDYERYLAKVVDIRNLTKLEISRLNWASDYRRFDKEFQRTNTLVTCQMADGSFRQFYAERSDMCRRPLVAGLLFKAGVAHMF